MRKQDPNVAVHNPCQRCGRCCRLIVQLKDEDIERIEKETGIDRKELMTVVDSVEGQGSKILLRLKGGVDGRHPGAHCVFLRWNEDGTTYCSIYQIRPSICRDYPRGKPCVREKLKL
jgi:Fe-S-cluster containining protein